MCEFAQQIWRSCACFLSMQVDLSINGNIWYRVRRHLTLSSLLLLPFVGTDGHRGTTEALETTYTPLMSTWG